MYLQSATPYQLQQAVAANHSEWMILKAQAATGDVQRMDGITWTYAGLKGEAMIHFPQLPEEIVDDRLKAVVCYYQDNPPDSLVGCWSLMPTQPLNLGERLLAFGFQSGWKPCWIWLDLHTLQPELHYAQPQSLRIRLVDSEVMWDADDLPYYERDFANVRYKMTQLKPQKVWYFAAYMNERLVGHSTLCVTTGSLGVAGLYDVGVIPAARNQGVGKAITLAACSHAWSLGCRHVLLNATGERMYEQLGFKTIGHGMTWWLDATQLSKRSH